MNTAVPYLELQAIHTVHPIYGMLDGRFAMQVPILPESLSPSLENPHGRHRRGQVLLTPGNSCACLRGMQLLEVWEKTNSLVLIFKIRRLSDSEIYTRKNIDKIGQKLVRLFKSNV